jgi:putative glutamine amidotransferase
MQPVIGITVGEVRNQMYPTTPRVQGQMHTYIDAIVRTGGVPLLIPLVGDEPKLKQLYNLCDGLLFAGGNDIDPELYGEKASWRTRRVFRERDDQELQLIKWALKDKKSCLCICRGMQLLNIARGGTLFQDIPTEIPGAGAHDMIEREAADYRHIAHRIDIKPASRLARILGVAEIGANAYHHQAIKLLGEGLVVTAVADDGIVVEAIEMPDEKFMIGVQSHPEAIEAKVEPTWRRLFTAFIEACQA